MESLSTTPNPTPSDWAGARGEKWLAQLAGMEAMLAPVDGPLLDGARLDHVVRIADIGCGGGNTSLQALRRAPAGSTVDGFDIAPGLVALARTRVPNGNDALAFHVADMESATPPGALYDRIVSRFGTMFFADPAAAFANLARWLAPGGRFAFAVWGTPAENAWFATTREAVAKQVALPPSEPTAPGPFRYADAQTLVSLLATSGLTDIVVNDWRGALAVGAGAGAGASAGLAAAGAAAFALASFSSFGELLAQAGEGAVAAARRELAARFAEHEAGGIVSLAARVHIVTGSRA